MPNASVVGLTEAAGDGPTPVPVKLTKLVGKLAALLTMRSMAERLPPAAGVNVIVFTQESPGAMATPRQLALTAKSFEFAPANVSEETINGAVPVFAITVV